MDKTNAINLVKIAEYFFYIHKNTYRNPKERLTREMGYDIIQDNPQWG